MKYPIYLNGLIKNQAKSSKISFISDSTQEKIGKFSPGSGIPIFSHEKIRNNPPDYIVLFAWNHKDEILEKESELRKQNLKWISLCPVIEILEYNDDSSLKIIFQFFNNL